MKTNEEYQKTVARYAEIKNRPNTVLQVTTDGLASVVDYTFALRQDDYLPPHINVLDEASGYKTTHKGFAFENSKYLLIIRMGAPAIAYRGIKICNALELGEYDKVTYGDIEFLQKDEELKDMLGDSRNSQDYNGIKLDEELIKWKTYHKSRLKQSLATVAALSTPIL